jgi:hypothetical protein
MNKLFVLFALIWVGKLAAAQTSGCQDQIQHFPGFDYISHPISTRYLVLERFCREYQNGECIFFDYQYVCRQGCGPGGGVDTSYWLPGYQIFPGNAGSCSTSDWDRSASWNGALGAHVPLIVSIDEGEKTSAAPYLARDPDGYRCGPFGGWGGSPMACPFWVLPSGSYDIVGGGYSGPGLYLATVTVELASPMATIRVPSDAPTIQQAIDRARPADTVLVDEGIYEGPVDFHGKAIAVRATGDRASTVIDGSSVDGSVVRATSGENEIALLQGFTIRNGTSGSLVDGQRVGGGMLIQNASPTIRDCAFVSNSADAGGGLAAINSDSVIDGCTFSSNTAGTGGGLWIDGGRPTVSGCVITSNTAFGHGGGLYSTPMRGQLPNVVLLGNTLCSNISADAGRENLWALFDDGGNAICDCFSDIDGDGSVDTGDLGFALLFVGEPTDPDFIQPDQDMNGLVDTGDLALLLLNFGRCE